jgi:glycosyltransferase involved in cell wall biosynthesis
MNRPQDNIAPLVAPTSLSPSSRPLISFIIATYGRKDELHRCLNSIASETAHDYEVIVVDQNPGDGLSSLIEEFSARMPLRHLRRPTPSVSAARNLGARYAAGLWLGFPDDDCYFLPSTIPTLRRLILAGDADLITGITVDEDGQRSILQWHQEEATINSRLLRRTLAESTLYLHRDVFQSVGGFDEDFGPGAIFPAEEGIDLIRRIWSLAPPKVRMRFSPELRFVHRDEKSSWTPARLQKARMYARGRGACTARHWKTFSRRRALVEISKHLIGSLVLRGLRRRSRYMTLLGYAEGFVQYHACHANRAWKWNANQLHLTRG